MRLPARTIWDIRIQGVCGIVSAADGAGAEIFFSGSFGQASLSPPRIVINPNRLYPIEPIIRRERRFAINILAAGQRAVAIRLINVRRRALAKDRIADIVVERDPQHGIPHVKDCLLTLFCEVEEILDTGDHSAIIAIVLDARRNPRRNRERPLLYDEVSGSPARYPRPSRILRILAATSGVKDALRRILQRGKPAVRVDLPRNTFEDGGQTEAEMALILANGIQDRGRVLSPPAAAPTPLRRRLGVCVVGVGAWGVYHCQLFRRASQLVDLYVCGRDRERLARVARAVGAKGYFVDLEAAVADPRIQAVSLVLPHDIHRWAVEAAAAGGKHALVEKPIAISLEDADTMIAAAKRAGVVLMVAEDMHFRPALGEAVAAIARGAIGEPLYLLAWGGGVVRPEGWKRDRDRLGGGVLMDIGVHYVRALRLLMGEPDRVFASRAMQVNTRLSGEDSVQLLLSSHYGWQAHVLLNWASPRGRNPDLVIMGEGGTIELWPGAAYFDHYPAKPLSLTRLVSHVRPVWLAERLSSPLLQRVRRRVPSGDGSGYMGEISEFLAAVSEERPPVSGPEDARRDLEIVLRGFEALRSQAWTTVEPYGPRTG